MLTASARIALPEKVGESFLFKFLVLLFGHLGFVFFGHFLLRDRFFLTLITCAHFTFAMALLALLITLLLSILPLLLAFSPSLVSFGLALQLGFFALFLLFLSFLLGDTTLLLDNGLFFALNFFLEVSSTGPSRLSFGSVFLVGLGASQLLSLRFLFADLGGTNGTDALLDGLGVDELAENLLGPLVHPATLQGTVNQRGRLSSVEGQELLRVALDFLFGNLEDCFVDFLLVVLRHPQRRCSVSNVTRLCLWYE